MSSSPAIEASVRDKILSHPEAVLEDPDLMRALVAANERAMGENIVDLRGIAMDRLEAQLGQLEDTHRSVIAAAYENLVGMTQVHRSVICLLEASNFAEMLDTLATDVTEILQLSALRLVLESHDGTQDPSLAAVEDTLVVVKPGTCDTYMTAGKTPERRIIMRRRPKNGPALFGEDAGDIRSEACVRLDLGPGRLPAMLLLGAEDAHRFSPQHGSDLLSFFSDVFERLMRRWLG